MELPPKLPDSPPIENVGTPSKLEQTGKANEAKLDVTSKAKDTIRASFKDLTSTLSSAQHRARPTAQRIASVVMKKIGLQRLMGAPAKQTGAEEGRRLSTPSITKFVLPKDEMVSLSKGMEQVKILSSPENRAKLKELGEKLTNAQEVLENCQNRDMKPKLMADGTLRAVYSPMGMGSHRGKSTESADALHYITDTLNQAAQAGVTSGLSQTLKAFLALPQLRDRVEFDTDLAVNLQQTMHSVFEADRSAPPNVVNKEVMLDNLLAGHAPTAHLLLQTHQNNQNSRNLFKDLSERFDEKRSDLSPADMMTAFNNILDLADMYISGKESLALGGKVRDDAKEQLSTLAQKAIRSGDPELMVRGESLQSAIDAEFTKRGVSPPSSRKLLQLNEQLKETPTAGGVIQAQAAIAAASARADSNEKLPAAIETLKTTLSEIIPTLDVPFSFENQTAETIADVASRELDSIWQSINPSEFDRLAWSKPDKADTAPNIVKATAAFNGISQLVQHQILTSKEPKVITEKVIDAAYIALKEGKFDSSQALLSGLTGNATHRLKKTVWNQLDPASQSKLDEMKAVFSTEKNWKALRAAINEDKRDTLQPQLGLFLTDLTKIDAGNPDSSRLQDGGEGVNLARNRLMQSVKDDLTGHINRIKDRGPVALDANFSDTLKLLAMRQDASEDELYRKSLEVEPRGSAT
ncbi:MAG: RasGEF domain-containing protein [Chlamydiales bacterium]|nr:RasGEF domain-containing protein [Chlamydiales bacterium]